MPKVQSSNLLHIDYDPSSHTLVIKFKDHSQYAYSNVPPAIYGKLMSADSHGEFFAKHIRNKYQHTKLA